MKPGLGTRGDPPSAVVKRPGFKGSLAFLPLMLCAWVVLLGGCGFHLRQEIALPAALTVLRVNVADAYSPLQRNLEQALERAGARAPVGEETGALLNVSRNRMRREPLSVGSTGRVQEYSLRYEVEFMLRDANKTEVLPLQYIELERAYRFDTAQAQGTPGEEEVVRAELERDMVQAILRRIDAALR